MISVADALSILSDHVSDRAVETVPLLDALGRVSAADICARVTLPPHNASAMDGYAVRLDDVRAPDACLAVIGDVPAGARFGGEVASGQAVRIFTGSPVPAGADHIVTQENTTRSGDHVHITKAFDTPRHIRRAGIDFTTGDVIVPRRTRLCPPEIALAAAGNHGMVDVLAKPRVAILTAGDELILPGSANRAGAVINSNTSAVSALIQAWSGQAVDMGLAKDDPAAIRTLFERAADADIILPIGGASVGDHDHMRRVFADLGGQMVFEKIAVKPGKPTWFGQFNGRPVLGLPGNPASAIVCAHLFLRQLMGLSPAAETQAQLTQDLPSNGPRETYLRAHVQARNGQLFVTPFPKQDSSLLSPFREANVLLRRLPQAEVSGAGATVDVIDLGTGPNFFATLL